MACTFTRGIIGKYLPASSVHLQIVQKAGVVLPPDENTLQTVEEGHNFVRNQVKDGADYIKILHESGAPFAMDLPRMPTSVVKAITDEAHTAGLTTLAHAFTIRDTLEVLSLGVDGTAHVAFDKPPTNELIEAFRKTNSFCIPTLTVIGSCTAESRTMQESYAQDPRVQKLLVEGGRQKLCQCSAMTSANDGSLRNGVETVRRLKGAGVDIVWYDSI